MHHTSTASENKREFGKRAEPIPEALEARAENYWNGDALFMREYTSPQPWLQARGVEEIALLLRTGAVPFPGYAWGQDRRGSNRMVNWQTSLAQAVWAIGKRTFAHGAWGHWLWQGQNHMGRPYVVFNGRREKVAAVLAAASCGMVGGFPTAERLCKAKLCVNPRHYSIGGFDAGHSPNLPKPLSLMLEFDELLRYAVDQGKAIWDISWEEQQALNLIPTAADWGRFWTKGSSVPPWAAGSEAAPEPKAPLGPSWTAEDKHKIAWLRTHHYAWLDDKHAQEFGLEKIRAEYEKLAGPEPEPAASNVLRIGATGLQAEE